MAEFIKSLCVLYCAITYWLGGQEIPWTKKGYKWIRRYLLPAGLFLWLLLLNAVWWKAMIACALLSGALHIGYQSKLWKYELTGLLMGLPALMFGYDCIVLLPAITHVAFGYVSLKDNRFKWAYVAILMGFSIGVSYIAQI